MKIEIKNEIFNLEKITDLNIYFPDYVKTYLENYIVFLENNKIKTEDVKKFTRGINCCLREYYSGQHKSAREFFAEAMGNVNFEELYEIINKESVFFRARKAEKDAEALRKAKEMFHIPLEMRYRASTERYSYPGIPCLYLGSSCEVCCEELNDWSENLNIAYIKKIGTEKIKVLNLHFFEKYNFEDLNEEDFKRFVKFWPLVACCSFSYMETKEMTFRPDYIIPQFLLEYIIDRDLNKLLTGKDDSELVCGIKYHSAKKKFFECSKEISYNNYVFPVNSDKKEGLSEFLEAVFEIKEVHFLKEVMLELNNGNVEDNQIF